jgi:NTP pyrophosphatase (non-canonical NTP hydrolase)
MMVWEILQDLGDLNNIMKGTYSYSNRHRMHKFMKYEKLQEKVIQWAKDRNILENSNAIKQISKTQEELDETLDALKRLEQGEESILEVADGIGDMLVTIILLANIVGLDSVDCLADAYEEIKNRKGKMVDGFFVKDE